MMKQHTFKGKLSALLLRLSAVLTPLLWGGVGGGLLLASCGEFIEFDNEEGEAATIKLKRNTIDLMVGDRYVVPATLEPAELANQALYWLSDNSDIVDFRNDTIVAAAPGTTFVTATVVAGMLTDTCWVTVHPQWQITPTHFQYDMVVYAHVTADGHEMDDSVRVAAFVGDELRGVGELRSHGDTDYALLRIYSESGEAEQVTLRCYDRRRALVTDHKTPITFTGGRLGTLSDLYELAF